MILLALSFSLRILCYSPKRGLQKRGEFSCVDEAGSGLLLINPNKSQRSSLALGVLLVAFFPVSSRYHSRYNA